MAQKKPLSDLSRRERQIMDVLYRDRQATAGEVLERLPDPPVTRPCAPCSGSSKNKGHIRHVVDGNRYVYLPRSARAGGRPALAGVLETFFDGSTEKAVAALLDLSRIRAFQRRSSTGCPR